MAELPVYKWEEINEHNVKSSRWVVIERKVYDVTNWSKKHPGGSALLGHVAGQDATEPFRAFHAGSMVTTTKYLKSLLIGTLDESEHLSDEDVMADFEKLRQTAVKMGLFDSSKWFFGLMLLHCILLEVLSYIVLLRFGTGWIPCIVSCVLFATSQTQLGWYQHDAGHLSIFKKTSRNRVFHQALFGVLKGASAKWWNHMHFQHHSKPNIIGKDPDVRLEKLFVVGEVMPVDKAKSENPAQMPYNQQHKYFFLIGPPLLFPVYFQFMTIRHAITRKLWLEGALMVVFYIKTLLLLSLFLGFWGTLAFFEVARVIESHWFTWVSQSNHIPMKIQKDDPRGRCWLRAQLHATCNVEQSIFNDWFTGHLNFQCEHHLFPTMPRHNYYKVAPLVKSLCEKHGVEYHVKPLFNAFHDIYRSLKKSGDLWLHTYEEFHST